MPPRNSCALPLASTLIVFIVVVEGLANVEPVAGDLPLEVMALYSGEQKSATLGTSDAEALDDT